METNWKEADFHKTEYSLDSPNPDLTYEIFEKFVKEWYHDPNPIIYKDKRVVEISFPSESFLQWSKQWAEINFPKSEPEVKQAMIRNLILSFIRFEVKSWHPLKLEGIHYWLYENSQNEMAEFIKNVKEKFYGQVNTVSVEEKPTLPERPSNILKDSDKHKGRYRLTEDDSNERKKIIEEANRRKKAEPLKYWKEIAREMQIPYSTLQHWRHDFRSNP